MQRMIMRNVGFSEHRVCGDGCFVFFCVVCGMCEWHERRCQRVGTLLRWRCCMSDV